MPDQESNSQLREGLPTSEGSEIKPSQISDCWFNLNRNEDWMVLIARSFAQATVDEINCGQREVASQVDEFLREVAAITLPGEAEKARLSPELLEKLQPFYEVAFRSIAPSEVLEIIDSYDGEMDQTEIKRYKAALSNALFTSRETLDHDVYWAKLENVKTAINYLLSYVGEKIY